MVIGSNNQGVMRIWLNNQTDDYTQFQMDVYLPDGYSTSGTKQYGEIKNIRFTRINDTSKAILFPDMDFVLMNEGIMSGIEDVMIDGGEAAKGVYDLYGRRLESDSKLAPGFYIIDGVKTHIK